MKGGGVRGVDGEGAGMGGLPPHNNTYTQKHTTQCKQTLVYKLTIYLFIFYMELILNGFEAGKIYYSGH
jgi:hypothetical protein